VTHLQRLLHLKHAATFSPDIESVSTAVIPLLAEAV
jgi:hypothetical protein